MVNTPPLTGNAQLDGFLRSVADDLRTLAKPREGWRLSDFSADVSEVISDRRDLIDIVSAWGRIEDLEVSLAEELKKHSDLYDSSQSLNEDMNGLIGTFREIQRWWDENPALYLEDREKISEALRIAASAEQTAVSAEQTAVSAEQTAASAESKVDNTVNRLVTLEAREGLAPGDRVDAENANLIEQPDTLTRAALDGLSEESTDASTTWGRNIRQAQVAPSLVPVYAQQEPLRTVHIQGANPQTAYAFRFDGSPGRPFDKTTDGGKTWVQKGTLPWALVGIVRLASGTLIAVQDTSRVSASNTQIARSTDDGATWTVINDVLRFPPLSAQGICEGTDGSIAIAEYGNVAGEKYRVRRSTDDGLTWTTVLESSGTEPVYDPGHFHSLTYDPIEKCHLAFLDRPDFGGFNGPQIWISRDNMATFTLLGESVDWDHPNFVVPMYFKNYIAWGSDNQINGRISRMKRSDFYSGNWMGKTEHVFQGNQQAMYWAAPVRDDVWLVFTNVEHINGPQDGRMGYASSVLVVDQDGARVSSGLDYIPMLDNVAVGKPTAGRMYAPSLPLGHTDSKGWAWIVTSGAGTIPVTQGWSTAVQAPRLDTQVILPKGRGIVAKKPDGSRFTPIRVNQNDVELGTNTTATRNTIRLSDWGGIEFASNGKVLAYIPNASDYIIFRTRIGFGETGTIAESLGINFGNSPPEGVITARGGSLYLCYDTTTPSNQGLWVKTNPGPNSVINNTGWVKAAGGLELLAGKSITAINPAGERYEPIRSVDSYTEFGVPTSGHTAGIRANKNGTMEFRTGGVVASELTPSLGYQNFRTRIGLGSPDIAQTLFIETGFSSPEGRITARGGALYLCQGVAPNEADAGLWVKETGGIISNTGWVKK